MQTTTLPIQVSGAAAVNAPQRAQGSEASQFGATLAREIEQRQPQPAAPRQAQANKQQDDADKAADKAPAAQDASAPADARDTAKTGAADSASAKDDESEGDDQQAQAAQPAADMLALIASFAQLQKAGATTGATAESVQVAGTKGAPGKAQPGLEPALKRLGKDDAGTAQEKADDGALAGGQRHAAAESAAARTGAGDGIDLRALGQGMAGARRQADTADFGAQMRDMAARLDAMRQAPAPAPQAPQAQFQAAALQAAQAAGVAGDHLTARVGTQAWDNQVGQKIVWMTGSGEQTASLTLNPPDLGPLQVVLSVTGDQASVAFSASQQEVRHALENALPRLREMMGESGIALGNATVSAGMPDQRQAQGDGGSSSGARGGPALGGAATVADSAQPSAATRTTMLGDGVVDTFA
jgi:flagellar hook-length control protein FliK